MLGDTIIALHASKQAAQTLPSIETSETF